ncbi:unnamed protein product [Closterium sp. NIES-53]
MLPLSQPPCASCRGREEGGTKGGGGRERQMPPLSLSPLSSPSLHPLTTSPLSPPPAIPPLHPLSPSPRFNPALPSTCSLRKVVPNASPSSALRHCALHLERRMGGRGGGGGGGIREGRLRGMEERKWGGGGGREEARKSQAPLPLLPPFPILFFHPTHATHLSRPQTLLLLPHPRRPGGPRRPLLLRVRLLLTRRRLSAHLLLLPRPHHTTTHKASKHDPSPSPPQPLPPHHFLPSPPIPHICFSPPIRPTLAARRLSCSSLARAARAALAASFSSACDSFSLAAASLRICCAFRAARLSSCCSCAYALRREDTWAW